MMAATATYRTAPHHKQERRQELACTPSSPSLFLHSTYHISHITHGRPTSDSRWRTQQTTGLHHTYHNQASAQSFSQSVSQAQPDPERGTQHRPRHLTFFSYVSLPFSFFDSLFPHLIKRPAKSRGMAWHNTAATSQVKAREMSSTCLFGFCGTHLLARMSSPDSEQSGYGQGTTPTPTPTPASGFDGMDRWKGQDRVG